jgi:hypothetical protein
MRLQREKLETLGLSDDTVEPPPAEPADEPPRSY